MRRKIALTLTAVLSCCCLGSCENLFGNKPSTQGKMDISNVTIPTFEESAGVQIGAYSGPTVANWSGTSRNVNTLTDEHMKKFKEAGFDYLIAVREGAPIGIPKGKDKFETIKLQSARAEQHAMQALALAEKYDIKYYVRDWPLYDLHDPKYEINTYEEYEKVITDMFSEDNPYIKSSAYVGNFCRDEPGVDEYEKLKWEIEIYQKLMKERGVEGELLINMLPVYGSMESFDGVTYQEYVDRYFEELAPLLGYFSYDFYPFLQDSTKGSLLRTTYLSNLEMLATKCKEGDYELRTFIQSQADFTGLRDLTSIADFRFQIYTNMAFGAKYMTYYEYGTFKTQHEGEFGLLNLQDGTYNYTYDLAKKVNNEIHAMEDAYMHFDYDGVMCFSSLPAGKINMHFRGVANALKSHPRIGEVEIENDAVITSFKDDAGNDAFMLLNYTDPYFEMDNRVTVQFKDAKGLLMYRFGKKEVVALNEDGTYTFELYPGEGRFIIPLK